MAFPKSGKIKKALKKIEKLEGTQGAAEFPTPLEKFRYDLQQRFVRYVLRTEISQRELALQLGVDEGKVSKILRNKLDDFSTDRLIHLLGKLEPNLKLKVG